MRRMGYSVVYISVCVSVLAINFNFLCVCVCIHVFTCVCVRVSVFVSFKSNSVILENILLFEKPSWYTSLFV